MIIVELKVINCNRLGLVARVEAIWVSFLRPPKNGIGVLLVSLSSPKAPQK